MMMKVVKRSLAILLLLSIVSNGGFTQPVSDPDPQRFSSQINAFMQWDAKNSFPGKGILFVGSSSIRFWETHRAFPDLPVINRGFGGSHISDVQYYYEQVIEKYAPSMIVFYAGDNDIAAGKPVQQVVEDYHQLVGHILEDFPQARVLYVPIKPSSSRWSYWPEMKQANQQIEAFSKQNPQLFYVDLATPLLNNGKPDDTLFMDDLLHLNSRGYAIWNRLLGSKLDQMMD